MNNADYAYSVAYIRSVENNLLDKNDIEGLILAKTPEEAMRILNDKGYTKEPTPPSELEKILSDKLEEAWTMVGDIAPKGAPLDILLYENDFNNLKVAVKSVFSGIENTSDLFMTPATVSVDLLEEAVADKKFDELPAFLKNTAERAYEAIANTEDSQLLDIIIDKASMDYTLKKAKECGSDFLYNYISLKNTLSDIKIAYRSMVTEKDRTFLEQALSEDGRLEKDGLIMATLGGMDSLMNYISGNGFDDEAKALKVSMSNYEVYSEGKRQAYLSESDMISLGIEPLLAYLIKIQTEISKIRIILSCKMNGFSENNIRERLETI